MRFGQKNPLETSPLSAQEFRRKVIRLFLLQVGTLGPLLFWYQYGIKNYSLGDQLYPLAVIVILQTVLTSYFARSRILLRRLKDIYPQVPVSAKRSALMLGICTLSPLASIVLLPFLAFKESGASNQSTPILFSNRALIPLVVLMLAHTADQATVTAPVLRTFTGTLLKLTHSLGREAENSRQLASASPRSCKPQISGLHRWRSLIRCHSYRGWAL